LYSTFVTSLLPMRASRTASLIGSRLFCPLFPLQNLAELCGNDRLKYVRLIAALVRIDLGKKYKEF
jgi:hypothetical protein